MHRRSGAGVAGNPGRWLMDDGADRVALVCVRDSRRRGLQVLLREDAAGAGAEMGGWSFPAGSVVEQDHAVSVLERCRGVTEDQAQRWLGHDRSPARALGFWVAGVRLLLAATGVLPVVQGARPAATRLRIGSRDRGGLGDALDIAAFLARQELDCDLRRLRFFSRWLDPDTGAAKGFFLAHLPERVRGPGFIWHAPEAALLFWRDRGLRLDFQTFAGLRTLTDFSSCDHLLSEYR